MSDSLNISVFDEPDLTPVLRLVVECYGDRAEPPEWWSWRHRALQRWPTLFVVVRDGDRIIGMQPVTMFPYSLKGSPVMGALLTGVMVHPDYRGRGLFGKLIAACTEIAWQQECAFVTTMPNDLSYPLFIKSKWIDPGQRTMLVRPLNLVSAAADKTGSKAVGVVLGGLPQLGISMVMPKPRSSRLIQRMANAEPWMDALDQRVREQFDGLVAARPSDWVQWRFFDCPNIRYDVWGLRERGYAATTLERRDGIRMGYLVDLSADDPEAARDLVLSALDRLKSQGAQAVTAVMTDESQLATLRKCGFMKLPKRIQPKEFFTVYTPNPNGPQSLDLLARIANWRQTLADWDGI